MKKKIAIARVWYEANSFSPIRTGLDAFKMREWLHGEKARQFYAGTATELGGAIAWEQDHPDYTLEFLHCCAAPPGGLIENQVVDEIEARILAGLRQRPWSAVYLSLHGAMASVSDPTPELRLIQRVRSAIGNTPLGASFDLHAHLGSEMLSPLDAISGYHTYPHIDMDRAAIRVLLQLERLLLGAERPTIAIAKVPVVLPSFNMVTSSGPMAELQRIADSWRERPGILDVSIFGGFAYGDSPLAGPSICAVAENAALADQAVNALRGELEARVAQFLPNLPEPRIGLKRALAAVGDGPAIVLDPADNPLSGGIGDTTALFKALLAIERPPRTVFAFFHDPSLVDKCHRLGPGAALSAQVGGRVDATYGPPVSIQARILKLTDGRFRNEGPMEHNLAMDVGRTVLLEVDGLDLIITETCQTPNDPAYFRLHGLNPETQDLICVKAKNHFRAAFASIARIMVDVDAPGPASASLDHYKYRHLPLNVTPLSRPRVTS